MQLQALELAALALGQADSRAGQGLAPGGRQLGDQRMLGPDPLRRPRSEHQAERAGSRRAVLAGHPDRERHHLVGERDRQHLVGFGEPVGLELGAVGELDHHPQRSLAAERHAEHRADGDLVVAVREQVVEGAADRAGARQRHDPRDHPRSGWSRRIGFESSARRGWRRVLSSPWIPNPMR